MTASVTQLITLKPDGQNIVTFGRSIGQREDGEWIDGTGWLCTSVRPNVVLELPSNPIPRFTYWLQQEDTDNGIPVGWCYYDGGQWNSLVGGS
jgi:hypothetical protein